MKMSGMRNWPEGWIVTLIVGILLSAIAGAQFALSIDPVSGARAVIRLTARTSLALFLLAFTAASLRRLAPTPLTIWLQRNRRYVGLSFAFSHALHLMAIVTLARLNPAKFHELTNVVTYVGGGLAYIFIVLLVMTSFDRTAALLGYRKWRALHLIGMWYIWLSFALNFGKRVPMSGWYLIPVLFVFGAAIIRLAARIRPPNGDGRAAVGRASLN
jgi:methionine sulfoxide reductase heme-binding subunit